MAKNVLYATAEASIVPLWERSRLKAPTAISRASRIHI